VRNVGWKPEDHTWVICAYQESPYLEDCILSLKRQTVSSWIVMVTSTPSPFLTKMAERYQIPIVVNQGEGGIGGDWNFALKTASTELITLAHQDDVYEPDYLQSVLNCGNKSRRPIMFFTDYGELRHGIKQNKSKLLRIKRTMLLPIRFFPNWKAARRLSLSLGNPICCPSVTYRKSVMEQSPFVTTYKSNLDWDQSERLSRREGAFVYIPRVLIYHRIHEASTTTQIIGNHQRTVEDYEIISRFWPKPLARTIARWYASSEKENQ